VVDLDPQVQIEEWQAASRLSATCIGTMPRRIEDGQSGFIVDPADEKQLADKIIYLLDNSQERKIMG
jgi:glycosyltransferase involved in cell wall biosynthesis